MAIISYLLSTLAALACAFMLTRAYRRTGFRLLLWSALCFWGLTISNSFLILDLLLLPHIDLYGVRLAIGFMAMLLLIYGLVWETR